MKTENRGNFSSKIGVILATVGTAVGLGNVWRFPYIVGENGGGAFLVIYILSLLLLGIPGVIAEFIVGRHSHANAVDSFKKLAPKTKWHWIGYSGVLAGFLIMGYYAVVVGWTLEYLTQAILGNLSGMSVEQYGQVFDQFAGHPYWPLVWMVIVMLISTFVVARGVSGGIEKISNVLMPVFFLIILVMVANSFFLPAAGQGMKYLFLPNFSELEPVAILIAIGQTFFSLSLGMGCLITYSSYFKKDVSLAKTATQVVSIDAMVAILSAMIIFPAVFSFGMQPTEGPSLVFKVLPNVFQQMPLGTLWSILFYALLFIAAITSLISLLEVVTAYIYENTSLTRRKAAFIVTGMVSVLGVFASMSFGLLQDVTLFGKTFFDLLDFVTASILLPVGGFFISIFVGWFLDKRIIATELRIKHPKAHLFIKGYIYMLRFFVPACIFAVFLYSLLG
ncbi:MAG: sodium-dependent transporter [Paludibacteraceae bacterium]|nr:sodium-dependent transporter [Paludibacteraceae bacterium]